MAGGLSAADEAAQPKGKSDGLLTTLQAGRAIAAIAVVLGHLAHATQAFVGGMPSWLLVISGYGYLGVDFFFVLSGFIIYHTNAEKIGPGWSRRYAESRFFRIYVPYLPVGVGLAALYLLLPGLSQGDREWEWLTSLTLAPTDGRPALSVAWTLRHEIVFYALALLAFLFRRPLWGMAIWAALIGLNQFLGGETGTPTSGFRHILLDPINLEFGFGMLAAWGFKRESWRRPLLFCALGASAIAIFFLTGGVRPWSVIFGLGLAFLLVPIVQAEGNGKVAAGSLLLLLGNASYAIYLVHNPILSVTSRLAGQLPGSQWLICFALGLTASVLGGIAYHLIYERPALRWLKGRLLSPRPQGRAIEPLTR